MPLHYKILTFVSIIIWLFPPIKQYRQNYFRFFLLLALTDPLTIVLGRSFNIVFSQLYVVFTIMFFLSLLDFQKLNPFKLILIAIVFATGFFSIFNYWDYSYLFITIMLFLILLIVVKNSFQFVIDSGSLNIFHIILCFYLITNMLKFWSYVQYFSAGLGFYYVTTSLQLFIGLFFSIYKENDLRLIKKIGEAKIN